MSWDWVVTGIYVVKACSVWRLNCLQIQVSEAGSRERSFRCSLAPASLSRESLGQSAIQPLYHGRLSIAAWRLMVSLDAGPYHNNSFTARFHTFLRQRLWAGVTLVTITPQQLCIVKDEIETHRYSSSQSTRWKFYENFMKILSLQFPTSSQPTATISLSVSPLEWGTHPLSLRPPIQVRKILFWQFMEMSDVKEKLLIGNKT